MKIITKNARQTKQLAAKLAKRVSKSRRAKTAKVIGLVGDLGSGKTTFIQGFIKTLGVKHAVTSPTFLIFRPYLIKTKRREEKRMRGRKRKEKKGKVISYNTVYHVDLYRVRSFKELMPLGFKNILANPRNIVLIEWADIIRHQLPKDTIWIIMRHTSKESHRAIIIQNSKNLRQRRIRLRRKNVKLITALSF